MILCILTSCLDHYTTSVLVKMVIVALYIYIVFTCRAQLTSVLSGWAQPRPAVEQSAWRRQCGGTLGRDIHAKNGYARWGHVQCHDMYIHGSYVYVQCTDMYIRST